LALKTTSAAKPHHFDVAPSANFDADLVPAQALPLQYTKLLFSFDFFLI
jgi:hypothetical protein